MQANGCSGTDTEQYFLFYHHLYHSLPSGGGREDYLQIFEEADIILSTEVQHSGEQ